MTFLKKAGGPPPGMEPDEALEWALVALGAYFLWQLMFPWYGMALR